VRAHCFACGWSADALGLIAEVRGLADGDFARVVREAAELVGLAPSAPSYTAPSRPLRQPTADPPREPLSLAGELAGVLVPLDADAAADVRAYLTDRRLLELATADGWLALDVDELKCRIDERIALDGDPMDGDLGRAGLVRQLDDGHVPAWPGHRLVIPWRTPTGEIDTIQRRALAGAPRAKYVFASSRRPMHPYGIERLTDDGAELVWVEGAIDALARRALDDGGRVVLGLPGVDGWRAEWAALARGRVVRIALDADEAGDRAAQRVAADVWRAGARSVLRDRRTDGADWADAWAALPRGRAA
jgi:DNA primase